VASSNALKVCIHYPSHDISYNQLHLITDGATHEMYSYYKQSLMLHKVINDTILIGEWTHLNFSQVFTSGQTNFICRNNNLLKTGLNAVTNRFCLLKPVLK
jgi:hypothetical protein